MIENMTKDKDHFQRLIHLSKAHVRRATALTLVDTQS